MLKGISLEHFQPSTVTHETWQIIQLINHRFFSNNLQETKTARRITYINPAFGWYLSAFLHHRFTQTNPHPWATNIARATVRKPAVAAKSWREGMISHGEFDEQGHLGADKTCFMDRMSSHLNRFMMLYGFWWYMMVQLDRVKAITRDNVDQLNPHAKRWRCLWHMNQWSLPF